MNEEKLKIVFFGAGAFAVPVLEALLKDMRLQIMRIITQVDKPAGRKGILTPTPLGQWCMKNALSFERCTSVNAPEFLQTLRESAPDLAVVVSFGQLLKEELLNLPRFGCLNVHASLLPEYRGASPIISVVLNGETETGVSFMRMDKGLDTGPVYQQVKMSVDDRITAVELEQKLAQLAGQKLGDCICDVAAGKLQTVEQDHTKATISRKIRKAHASVIWEKSAAELSCQIRAFHPWPSSIFIYPGEKREILVKISSGRVADPAVKAVPGTVLAVSQAGITVACGSGSLLLERLIPEGKKEMNAADFANGFRLETGVIFHNGPVIEK